MLKTMFIWRKSIYDNNFKCNECGAKLFNPKTGKPTDNLAIDANATAEDEKHLCFCAKCQNVVAKWDELDVDEEDTNILRGSYSEWIEKKALDMKEELLKRVEERLEKKYEQKIKDLENQINSKESTISKVKLAYEIQQKDKDKKIRELQQKIEHLDNVIRKMQTEKLRDDVEKIVGDRIKED